VALSSQEISETLEEYTPWVRRKALQFSSSNFPTDDLVQEALLAMWKELIKYDESKPPLDYIMKRRATWRMQDMVGGRPWTTGESTYRDKGLIHTPQPAGDLTEEYYSLDNSVESYTDVDFTIYRDDIVDALNKLTPKQREYAVVRYMYGYKHSEIIEHFGYEAHALVQEIHKEKLRKSLAHLESLVK
jgi:RNA polymerase sigma factor (sigma-70 family)